MARVSIRAPRSARTRSGSSACASARDWSVDDSIFGPARDRARRWQSGSRCPRRPAYSERMSFRSRCAAIALASVIASTASAQTRRALTLNDHSRFVGVGDPQRSPDGLWVAYTVTTIDPEKDKRDTDVWMVRWDGTD